MARWIWLRIFDFAVNYETSTMAATVNDHCKCTRPGLFQRPGNSFELDSKALQWILADPANPLNQLASLIPSGSTVLDVGAGNGVLARLLRHVQAAVVVDGVEPDATAASLAAPWYRKLYQGSIESFLSDANSSIPYDFIILADVMEHLPDPEHVLRLLRPRLGTSGKLCVSTPNVAFASVRIALLNGAFDYVDSGILERTHLRFFTLRSLNQLFAAVDLSPENICLLRRNPLDMEIRLSDFRISPMLLWRLLRDDLSTVYQFLFVLGNNACHPAVTSYGDPGSHVTLKYLKQRLLRRLAGGLRRRRAGG